jgi:hypothetical protein
MASQMSTKQSASACKNTGIVLNMSLDHARAQYAQYRANGYPWTTRRLTPSTVVQAEARFTDGSHKLRNQQNISIHTATS